MNEKLKLACEKAIEEAKLKGFEYPFDSLIVYYKDDEPIFSSVSGMTGTNYYHREEYAKLNGFNDFDFCILNPLHGQYFNSKTQILRGVTKSKDLKVRWLQIKEDTLEIIGSWIGHIPGDTDFYFNPSHEANYKIIESIRNEKDNN